MTTAVTKTGKREGKSHIREMPIGRRRKRMQGNTGVYKAKGI